MNEKSKIVITNNPKVQSFFTSQNNPEIEILFVEKRDEVFTKARDFIHNNWKLLNHTMMANIPLHQHPYRSFALKRGATLDTDSLLLMEQAAERLTRGKLPNYDETTLNDFQDLDLVLFKEVKI
jgi:grdX protein